MTVFVHQTTRVECEVGTAEIFFKLSINYLELVLPTWASTLYYTSRSVKEIHNHKTQTFLRHQYWLDNTPTVSHASSSAPSGQSSFPSQILSSVRHMVGSWQTKLHVSSLPSVRKYPSPGVDDESSYSSLSSSNSLSKKRSSVTPTPGMKVLLVSPGVQDWSKPLSVAAICF